MDRKVFRNICSRVIDKTKKNYISFEVEKKKSSIFNSKLGGIPYMPKEYNQFNNKKLCFLGQINFDELPYLKNFPKYGMLQFFISTDENKMWGASEFKEYRVIYHEFIDYSVKEQTYEKKYVGNFPVRGEYLLKGKINSSPITVNDYRFNEIFMREYKKHVDTTADGYWEIEGINEDEINEIFSNSDIKCGGNPSFIQDDIRECNSSCRNSMLLFEIPTVLGDDISISWGDSGIANFFINKEDLVHKNFKNVFFYWDCY